MTRVPDDTFTPARLSDAAAALFPGAGLLAGAKAKYRPYICPFHTLLPIVPLGSRALDIGCGNGLLLGLLAATGRIGSGAGYDLTESVVAHARAMAGRMPPGTTLEFSVGDSHACVPGPAGGRDFDVVLMVDVLHHVPPPIQESFWRGAASRVRPGGLMIYKDMVNYPDWRAFTNVAHDIVLAGQRSRYVPVALVERWGADEGLSLERSARINMLWYGHELRVFRRP
ncbi:MAG: class I SAM-dependent methyltransferase [Phycisphaerales bacterium]